LYGFFVATMAIAPLQGFWNCVVYFRPRLMARLSGKNKKRALKRANESALSGEGSSFGRKFPFRFRASSTNSHAPPESVLSEETSRHQSTDEPDDPSAAIAMLCSRSETSTGLTSDEDKLARRTIGGEVNLDGIREELEQLEGAELEIESFSEEGQSQN
jgi:hypothetical protein